MSYTIDVKLAGATMAQAEERARAALADGGFGVVSDINVQAVLKEKAGADIGGYRILGACVPAMAQRAIEVEPRVGTMLPCNVILREVPGGVEVSAVDPVASMQAIRNPDLAEVADEVRGMMQMVMAMLEE